MDPMQYANAQIGALAVLPPRPAADRTQPFGRTVRAHRRRMGLSQEELAERVGVSVRTIGNIEAGRIAAPRPVTVRLLAKAFDFTGADHDWFCDCAGAPAGTGQRTRAAAKPTGADPAAAVFDTETRPGCDPPPPTILIRAVVAPSSGAAVPAGVASDIRVGCHYSVTVLSCGYVASPDASMMDDRQLPIRQRGTGESPAPVQRRRIRDRRTRVILLVRQDVPPFTPRKPTSTADNQ